MSARSFILIGCEEAIGSSVRIELSKERIPVLADFADPRAAFEKLSPDQTHMAAIFLPIYSAEDIRYLAKMSATFPGCPIMAAVDPREHADLILAANRAGIRPFSQERT